MKLEDLKHMIRQELVASLKGVATNQQTVKERTVTFPSGPWKPKRTMTAQQIKDRDSIGKEMLASASIVAKVKELYGKDEWESYLWGIASATAIDDDGAAQDRTLQKMAKAAKNRALNKKGEIPSWKKQKDKKSGGDKSPDGPVDKVGATTPAPAEEPKDEPKAEPTTTPEKKPSAEKSKSSGVKKISGRALKKAKVKKKLAKGALKKPTKKVAAKKTVKAPTKKGVVKKSTKKVDPKKLKKAKKISKARGFSGTAGFRNHPLAQKPKKQKAETAILTSETQV